MAELIDYGFGISAIDAGYIRPKLAAIHLIVHVSRLPTGERRLMSIAEITGHDERGMLMREVFSYDVDARVHRDLRKAA